MRSLLGKHKILVEAPTRYMLQTPIARLRLVGMLEGASFLVLLGVAMPLKYLGGIDLAVKIAGWTHGVLFIAFCLALFLATRAACWGMSRAGGLLVAALVPFGPFLVDGRLRREQERLERDRRLG